MSAHTPGPWQWCAGIGGSASLCRAGRESEQVLAIDLAEFVSDADKSLIAAAPELLGALRAMTAAAEFDFCGESTADCADDECVAMEDGSAFTFGLIRRARAAIEKAEGK